MQAVAARYSGGFDPDGGGPLQPLRSGRAGASGPKRTQPGRLARTTIRRQGDHRARPVPGAAERLLQRDQGGQSRDPGGDRRHQPLRGPAGWPLPAGRGSGAARAAGGRTSSACKPAKSKKKGKKKEAKSRSRCEVRADELSARASRCSTSSLTRQSTTRVKGGLCSPAPTKDDVSTPDLGRVVRIAPRRRAGSELSFFGRSPGLGDPVAGGTATRPNPVGAPLLTPQARWIEQSLYLFWKAGASAAINFEIRDSTAYPVPPAIRVPVGTLLRQRQPEARPHRLPLPVRHRAPRPEEERSRPGARPPRPDCCASSDSKGGHLEDRQEAPGRQGRGLRDQASPARQAAGLRATVGSSTSVVSKQAAFATRSRGGGGPGAVSIVLMAAAALALALALVATAFLRRRQVRRQRHRRARGPLPTG